MGRKEQLNLANKQNNFSGGNVHLVQNAAPDQKLSQEHLSMLTLSASTTGALRQLAGQMAAQLLMNSGESESRVANEERLSVVLSSLNEVRAILRAFTAGEQPVISEKPKACTEALRIAFLFTGFGSQYVGMGRTFLMREPLFRFHLERCDEILRAYLEKPLLSVLYPQPGELSPLHETRYAQPAIFAVEYALVKLLQSWGIEPAVVIGHSMGEYIAACIAGVFSLEDGLKLMASCAHLMNALPPNGEMAAVFAEPSRVSAILREQFASASSLDSEVVIAAYNSPQNVVISGGRDAVQKITAVLQAQEITVVRLKVSVAVHSSQIDPMLADFLKVAQEITYSSPKIPFVSNVSGQLTAELVATPEYWVRHMRAPVRFAAGLETLYQQGYKTFVEIGPKPQLLDLGQQCLPDTRISWLPTLRKACPGPESANLVRDENDWSSLLHTLGQLYALGVPVNWSAVSESVALRGMVLPTDDRRDESSFPSVQEEARQHHASSVKWIAQLEDAPQSMRQKRLQRYIQDTVMQLLAHTEANKERPHPQQGFFEMGMDSLTAIELKKQLEAGLGYALPLTLAFKYPSIEAITTYLLNEVLPAPTTASSEQIGSKLDAHKPSEPIAIVGMGCRFPGGANDPSAYWQLLRDGLDGMTEVPADRWDIDAYYDPSPDVEGKMYTRWGGFLDQVDQFDAQFFGISPREAVDLDPQHRLLLEVSWEALERAGLAPSKLRKTKTGVFIGVSFDDYAQLSVLSGDPTQIRPYASLGNYRSVAAGRIAYVLGLQGPTMQVDTACSSSLLAIHLAVMSLRAGESNLALAGGVNLMLSPSTTIGFCKLKALAPDGRCKTFDAAADGYARGEGAGMIVLKRLSDAQADGDPILALIRGSAVNHDGPSSGLTVPNQQAQEDLIRQALKNGQVKAHEVSYVEAHGTGTFLGDPIEVDALATVYGTQRQQPLMIGSVKTNMGHLESAAGIAGVMKVVLALQHKEIPPHLNFTNPNPNIPWHTIPIAVPTERTKWPQNGKRLAGVSSFGMSGTNAHVVLEEAPTANMAPKDPEVVRPWHLLTLSAKTEAALEQLKRGYADHLARHPGLDLADICFTANTGRSHFQHRQIVVAQSQAEMRDKLLSVGEANRWDGRSQPEIAFLFTGQGSQYVGMGRELYETQLTFRKTVERCDEIWRSYGSQSLIDILLRDESRINQTAYTQVALFALEYALAKLWQSWGVVPDVVMGHSVGELVAACVAGIFSLEDGLRLTAERGRLMQALPKNGTMMAVQAAQTVVAEAIAPYAGVLSIAAINGPKSVVISGTRQAVHSAVARLPEGIRTVPLTVSHAFHSPLMEPMLGDFLEVARSVTFNPPQACADAGSIKLIANATGDIISSSKVATPEYWSRHVRETVRFAEGMEKLHQLGVETFVEIGPKPTLLGMGRRCLPDDYGTWLPSLRPDAEWSTLLASVAQLYVRGAEIDWAGFYRDNRCHKIVLPTYPFQRERYWIDGQASKLDRRPMSSGTTPTMSLLQQGKVDQLVDRLGETTQLEAKEMKILPKLLDLLYQQHQRELMEATIENWLYQVEWQPKVRSLTSAYDDAGSWLILADHSGVGASVAEHLQARGQSCLVVYPQDLGANHAPDQFKHLLQEAQGLSRAIRGVIHLWSLDATPSNQLSHSVLSKEQNLLCGSLLHLVQATVKFKGLESVSSKLWVVTRGAQPTGRTPVAVAQAPVWGLGKVVALEHPDLWGGLIDLAPQPEADEDEVAALLAEITAPDGETQLAFRDGKRLVARLVRTSQKRVAPDAMPPLRQAQGTALRSDGSYLITGGLGALGLQMARFLVEQGVRHLALMGRRGISSRVAQQAVSQLEQAGATVLVVKADVSNEQACLEGLNRIKTAMPPLRGVVHAAGVLDDGILLRQSYERFKKVMRAKVEGTWHLHTLTAEDQLDFFVCFSSVASLMGSAGQANYAAANAFMDALAHYRHSVGLPALSINWGPWAESGMAVRTDFNAQGVTPITPEQGMQAFKRLLPLASSVGVINVDWSQYSVGRVRQFLEKLVKVQVAPEKRDLWQQLEKAPLRSRREILVTHLQNEVAQVLGLTHQLPVSQGFAEMGLDSLMALELKNRLANSLGRPLPSTLAFDYPTVNVLAQYLSQEVLARKEPQKEGLDMSENLETTPLDSVPRIEQLSANELMAQIAVEFDEAYL